MSTFTIHTISYDSEKKYNSGTILKHYIMNNWLETNGIIEYKYELHKDSKIHSIWKFNEKTQRWCRTATPSKKNITAIIFTLVCIILAVLTGGAYMFYRRKSNETYTSDASDTGTSFGGTFIPLHPL